MGHRHCLEKLKSCFVMLLRTFFFCKYLLKDNLTKKETVATNI